MRFNVSKLLFIGLLGVVLGACSANAAEDSSEDTTEEAMVDTVEAAEEMSIVSDEITTTFYPEVTRLRDLTEEDLEWYDIIMARLNAIDDHSGDRETVYEIAEEYGEDPEELWFDWLEIVDAKWHGNNNYAILTDDYNKLIREIIEKNIVGEKIEIMDGGFSSEEESLPTSVNYQI